MGMMTDPAFEKMTGRKYEQNVKIPAAEWLAQHSIFITNPILLADFEVVAKVIKGIKKVAAVLA